MEISFTTVNFLYKGNPVALYSILPGSTDSGGPVTQNSPCAKGAYFEAAHSSTLHYIRILLYIIYKSIVNIWGD